ncbi:MAG: F0F1 ATP synthase subunit gamma [Rhodospirillaceae bacterium TMED8]|nr:F0F1 ATP synthase subunit gamma [Magnetovibrio sp.]OUT48587.1 MAG: F0F1 ATP synthase subunit gamma [Rhodospirillaceae bacterium TMED8]
MPNLKDLRVRIDSVKSTQKITSAMKMVAAAKLRRAQESAEAARPYAMRMENMLGSLAGSLGSFEGAPKLLSGSGSEQTHLLVPFTANRGLCGGFNGSIVRRVRDITLSLKGDEKTVKILCVGRKGHDVLRREFPAEVIDSIEDLGKRHVEYSEAVDVADKVTELFHAGEFDICTIIFNRFQSAMTQIVTPQQLIPFIPADIDEDGTKIDSGPKPVYIFEPEEESILDSLLPRNLAVQVFQALLESSASEHGARMTAMDSATRNAGDMIDNLTLTYNRTRQAFITKELIEIISGAEAL